MSSLSRLLICISKFAKGMEYSTAQDVLGVLPEGIEQFVKSMSNSSRYELMMCFNLSSNVKYNRIVLFKILYYK